MINFETSVVINRPVEQVFAYVDNTDNDTKWQEGVLESKQDPVGPVAVGTKVNQSFQFLGQRLETSFEVTEHEPNQSVKYKSISGPIDFESLTTFETVDDGTKLNLALEADVSGVFKLAEPLVARNAKSQWEKSFASLKEVLETEH